MNRIHHLYSGVWVRLILAAVTAVSLTARPAFAEEDLLVSDEVTTAPDKDRADGEPVDGNTANETEPGDDQADAEPPLVGWLEIAGALREGPPPFAWVEHDAHGTSLSHVVEALDRVRSDDRFAGVVVYLNDPMLTLSQVEEISSAIGRAREAGKTTAVFSESYNLTSYLLACAAEHILLQRKGEVLLMGLGVEEMYLADLLGRVGLHADLLQVGRFKGADESLTRSAPSGFWSENIDGVLDDLYAYMTDHIASARGMTPDQVEAFLADCWTLTDTGLRERGVIDGVEARDLIDATGRFFGEEFAWEDLLYPTGDGVDPNNPFALFRMLFEEPGVRFDRPTIAVVHVSGPINRGESGGDAFGGQSAGSQTITRALRDAADSEWVKGVVVRIDSPGGSALASEMIWQAVREVAEDVPVYISIGSLAASGGYYIASAGDLIYAPPASIVGSIGVVGGKIVLGGLYEKIGVAVHRRSRGALADMFNSVEPFTERQRQTLTQSFQRVYEQFTQRVADGRGDRIADIDQIAQGRLFTGRQAIENGMIDRLGGLHTAVSDMASELELVEGEYDVIDLPPPLGFSEFLEEMFGVHTSRVGAIGPRAPRGSAPVIDSSSLQTARLLMGPRAWRSARAVLAGLVLLRDEPTLTLMPTALIIR